MCCTRLAEIQDAKNRHLGTIAQLCRAVSSQRRHISTIGKNFLNSNISSIMSKQYGKLQPTNGWDRFVTLGHPSKFQEVSRLGVIYCSDVAYRTSTKVCTMFGRLLGWYTMYTFLGALAPWEFCQVQHSLYVQVLCCLLYSERYCTAL